MTLSPNELSVLSSLPRKEPAEAIAAKCGVHPDAVRKSAEALAEKGLLSITSSEHRQLSLTPEGKEASISGLPECLLAQALLCGPKSPPELGTLSKYGLPAAKRLGWISVSSGAVSLTDSGRAALSSGIPLFPKTDGELSLLSLQARTDYIRRGLISEEVRKEQAYSITPDGEAFLAAAPAATQPEASIGAITREMLRDGSWAKNGIRSYDISASTPQCFPARRHPISALRESIARIFTRMGFEEMSGPMVESAFWNFDALFQPQDHPARDLADTFYVSGQKHLPNRALVERVRHSHSSGWGYAWSEAPAKKTVLRTHTTAVSARSLHSSSRQDASKKLFCIGKVFRNEATDYKHLAEFFQVEGIIAWEGATFRDLLGTLNEFYSQLGFPKIRFRPSYFPYTEPSLEIEVFHPARKEWMELGGAGILRPEVCGPLGSPYPVLAWGLSLERPLMLSHKIDDIRSLYRNELGWLRAFPLM